MSAGGLENCARYALQAKYEFEQQLRVDEVKDFSEEVERMDKLMDVAPDQHGKIKTTDD